MHYLIQSYHLIFPSDESPLILDSKMETVAKLNPPFRGNFKTCKSSAFFNLSRNTCKLRSRVWYVDKSKNLYSFDLSNLQEKIARLRSEQLTAGSADGCKALPGIEGILLHSEVEEFCLDPFSSALTIFVLATDGTVQKLQSNDGRLPLTSLHSAKRPQEKKRGLHSNRLYSEVCSDSLDTQGWKIVQDTVSDFFETIDSLDHLFNDHR